MQAQMLAPAAVLVLWSLVMLIWTAATRLPAMARLGTNIKTAAPGGRGQNLDGVLPDSVQWKSHNYAHLMEQPTIFYPTVVIIALMGPNEGTIAFAWAYVALRIIHSVWQATVNTIPVRFTLFLLSTACLILLAVHAAELTLFAKGVAA
ncbi:MAPEG family protein [Novosphingobium sp.]|uniref:MAPEG family protein n=1 Tax=Novosphingobium sp. TaxID=1874826 RepID=UPI001EC893BE|nr:MAPEG family protein [Novosphingobium sp.]MBK6800892.1 MAPEG family protein [Novosphingobium sp.]MBK9011450.1 MAPEG family protein [Novosphingobium sp.]